MCLHQLSPLLELIPAIQPLLICWPRGRGCPLRIFLFRWNLPNRLHILLDLLKWTRSWTQVIVKTGSCLLCSRFIQPSTCPVSELDLVSPSEPPPSSHVIKGSPAYTVWILDVWQWGCDLQFLVLRRGCSSHILERFLVRASYAITAISWVGHQEAPIKGGYCHNRSFGLFVWRCAAMYFN